MAALDELVSFERIYQLLQNNTFEEISEILQEEFPDARGLSVKSIKRFCQTHGIKKRGLVSDNELDELLKSAIQQVILARLCKVNCAVVCKCALNLSVCVGYYVGWTCFWTKDDEGSY